MLVLKDFSTSILAASLSDTATSIVVGDAGRFPSLPAGSYFYAVLQKFADRHQVEIVKVVGANGNTFSVERAQAGTAAKHFSVGDYIELRLTVATFDEYVRQSVSGKLDSTDGVVYQTLLFENAGDGVRSSFGVRFSDRHETVIGGAEGVNAVAPSLHLRPLGRDNKTVEALYTHDGVFRLVGGASEIAARRIILNSPDATGWPNGAASSADNYARQWRSVVQANNSSLYLVGDGTLNARRFGFQVGNADPALSHEVGVLELNPYGGDVRVNGGSVYHTNYRPTPAAIGALPAASVGSFVELAPFSLSLAANRGSGGGIGGWARQFTVSGGLLDSDKFNVGAYGSDAGVGYGFLGIGSGGDFFDSLNTLRVHRDYASWGTYRLYHEGYLPTPAVLGALPVAGGVMAGRLTAQAGAKSAVVFSDGASAMFYNGNSTWYHQYVSLANELVIGAGGQGEHALLSLAYTGLLGTLAQGVLYGDSRKPSPEDINAVRKYVFAPIGDVVQWLHLASVTANIGANASSTHFLIAGGHNYGNTSCPLVSVKINTRGYSSGALTDDMITVMSLTGEPVEWEIRASLDAGANKINVFLRRPQFSNDLTIAVLSGALSDLVMANSTVATQGNTQLMPAKKVYSVLAKPTSEELGVIGVNKKNYLNNADKFGVGFISAAEQGAGWIASYYGTDAGTKVVMGSLSGLATIGAHSPSMNEWADLHINSQDGVGGISNLTIIGNPCAKKSGDATVYRVYHEGYKPTAHGIGAAPDGFGVGGYCATIGTVLGDCDLRRQGGFFHGSLVEGIPAEGHTWKYIINACHANPAGYFGYIAIDFDLGHAWLGGQSGGVQRQKKFVFQTDRIVGHTSAGIGIYSGFETYAASGVSFAPSVRFHKADAYAGMIQMTGVKEFAFVNDDSSAHANLVIGNINTEDVFIRSDVRLKTNFVELRGALDKLSSLQAYYYDKKDSLSSEEYSTYELGLKAQDVEVAEPVAVRRVGDLSGEDVLAISGSAINALLVQALNELRIRVEELERDARS